MSQRRGTLVFSAWMLSVSVLYAGDIELSLNLRYNDPADPSEGGLWTLVGLTDDPNGIGSVRAIINNVDNDPSDVIFPGGLAAVDPVDLGFGPRPAVIASGSILDLAVGQDLSGSVVTGIGTGAGSPSDIGLDPLYNADWSHASVLARGTFSTAAAPVFTSLASEFSSGSLFTTTSGPYSTIPATQVSTVVRGDKMNIGFSTGGISPGDYNRDFRVDLTDWNIILNNYYQSNLGWDGGDADDDSTTGNSDWKSVGHRLNTSTLPPHPVIVSRPTTTTDFEITTDIVAAYDMSYNPIPIPVGQSPEPVILQFDVFIEIGNLEPAQMGFGNVLFDIEMYGLTDCCGWSPNAELLDINGSAPGGLVSLFGTNEDWGPHFNLDPDLKDIIVEAGGRTYNGLPGPSPTDPRVLIGQSGPQLIGSVFVEWDGTFPAALAISNVSFSTRGFDGKFQDVYDAAGDVVELNFLTPADNADFNWDGLIDFTDLAIWQSHYGQEAGLLNTTGDADRDGDVDGSDFLVWQQQYAAAQNALASVPEPSALILVSLGVICFASRRIFGALSP